MLEALVEICIDEFPRGKGARSFGGKYVGGKRVIGDARFHIVDADGRGASGDEQRETRKPRLQLVADGSLHFLSLTINASLACAMVVSNFVRFD